jgi:hypothetical protein
MFWSLAPLVLACVVLAGLVGMCSFRPNGPADGAIPPYDAAAALQDDANALNFPIRLPALPAGWQSNSGTRTGIEAGRTDPGTGERQRAVVALTFYLGEKLRNLKKFLACLEEEDWIGAAYHLLDSRWAGGQAKIRAARLAEMVKNGG